MGKMKTAYDNPRDLALQQIAIWDRSVQNIQDFNSASTLGLGSVAAATAYRTARNLSRPATLGLATLGLWGLGMNEAFVQVSRINAYLAGIKAVECALAEYDGGPVPPDQDDLFADVNQYEGGDIAVADYLRLQALADSTLATGLRLAISRISYAVDQLLVGSIVSATSISPVWQLEFTEAMQLPKVDLGDSDMMKTMARGAERANADHIRALNQVKMQRAMAFVAQRADQAIEARARMDLCNVGSSISVQRERIPSPPPSTAFDLLGSPATVAQSATWTLRLVGANAGIQIWIEPSSKQNLPTAVVRAEGDKVLVDISATQETAVGPYVLVAALPTGMSKTLAFDVVEAEK